MTGRPRAGTLRRCALRAAPVLLGLTVAAGCVNAPVTPAGPPTPPASSGPAAGAPAAGAPAADAAPSRTPQEGRAADVAYARAMVPHHGQALELAALVGERAASPAVRDLAFRIDREQVEELGQLQGQLRAWGVDPPEPTDTSAMSAAMGGMSPAAMGMATTPTLDRLRTTAGPPFDRLWLETMIRHHEGAIGMAREHLATGADRGLRTFSDLLLITQGAEIDRMRALLAGSAGS